MSNLDEEGEKPLIYLGHLFNLIDQRGRCRKRRRDRRKLENLLLTLDKRITLWNSGTTLPGSRTSGRSRHALQQNGKNKVWTSEIGFGNDFVKKPAV